MLDDDAAAAVKRDVMAWYYSAKDVQ